MNKLYEYGVNECIKSIKGILPTRIVKAIDEFLTNKKSQVLVLDKISQREKDLLFKGELWRALTDYSADGQEHYKEYALGHYYNWELYKRTYGSFSGVEVFGLYKYLESRTKGINVDAKVREIIELYKPSDRLVVNITLVDVVYGEVVYFLEMLAQRFDIRMTIEKSENGDLIKGKYVYKLEIMRNISELPNVQKDFRENSNTLCIHTDILEKLTYAVNKALGFNMEDLEIGSEIVFNVMNVKDDNMIVIDKKFLTYDSLSSLLRFTLRKFTKPESINLDVSVDEKCMKIDLHLTKIS